MKIFLPVLLFIAQFGFSQISLEHTYNNHKTHSVRISMIDENNTVYYMLDDINDEIRVYNLDNTLLKTMTVPSAVRNGRSYIRVIHLTKYLFDSDEEYEYLISFSNTSGSTHYYSCYILNEDGTVLLDGSNFIASATTNQFGGVNNDGIIKKDNGDVKIVLSNFNPDSSINKTQVYSLPGVVYTLSKEAEIKFKSIAVVPNPTINKINLVYHGNVNDGEIIIYSQTGQLIKQVSIEKGTSNTKVDLSKFSTGTYYYQVYENGQKIGVKKVINN